MTVAAVSLAGSVESALADADGVPRIRRIADSAWAGGALPIVVVSLDPDGNVADALAGSEASLVEPVPAGHGPVGQICHGIDVAAGLVTEIDAALVWPARMGWVGPETVTSLIEAHGPFAGAILEPTYRGESGWPKVVPLVHLEALRGLPPDLMPDALFTRLAAAGIPVRSLDLGDPGVVIDGSTALADLPAYEGPPENAAGHTHEWGDAIAELPGEP